MNGFLDPGLLGFVFTPMVLTLALLVGTSWSRARNNLPELDGPARLLAVAIGQMPVGRQDWGAAMLAELKQVQGAFARWQFALGCARVALFPPGGNILLRCLMLPWSKQVSICGILAVALPPLALPFLYFAAVIAETLLKQGGMSLSESHPGLVRGMMLFSASFVLAGLLLGIIGWLRRERLRWLPVMGMLMCPGIVSYVAVGLHVMGGGLAQKRWL